MVETSRSLILLRDPKTARRYEMTSRTALFLLMGVILTGCFVGCGGGGGQSTVTQSTQPISVSFLTAPPSTLAVNATVTISATVANSTTSSQVAWGMTCTGTGSCGSFTASNIANTVVYTAPSTISSGETVTITATSIADSTKSVSATIVISDTPISVSFFGSVPASMLVNTNIFLTASVSNGPPISMVVWTVTCGGTSCGSFSLTTVSSNYTITYTAPALTPPGNTVTVTATSVTDPTKSASAVIAITTPAPTGLEFAPSLASTQPGGSWAAMTAVATNAVIVPIQWTVTCGGTDCGSFSPATVEAGTQTVYTAPSAIPPGNTVTITASSVNYPSISVSATITITTPLQSLVDGQYVFLMSGGSPTGAFIVKNGAITAMEEDYIAAVFQGYDGNGDPIYANNYFYSYDSSGGSFSISSAGVLNIVLPGGGVLSGLTATGPGSFSSTVCAWCILNEVFLQTSTSAPQGEYIVSGAPNTLPGLDGTIYLGTSSGPSGQVSNLTIENCQGTNCWVSGSGTTSVGNPDGFGRFAIQFNPQSSSAVPQINMVGYTVDAKDILWVETQGDAYQGTLKGSTAAY